MGQVLPGVPAWLLVVLCVWIITGLAVYSRLGRYVLQHGGKVSAKEFGIPDLFMGGAFASFFLYATVHGFAAPVRVVVEKDLVNGAISFGLVVLVIWAFLWVRGIPPWKQFGLLRRNVFVMAGAALGLIWAAFPFLVLIIQLTEVALHGHGKPQSLVEYFLEASRDRDYHVVYLTLGLAVVVAPITEETIFRGYLYGTLKRYVGPLAAAVSVALLFAAVHLNLASLPALFLLALSFTLAYEASGSLLLNIMMHGLFNLTMLLLLLVSDHYAHPA